MKKQPEIRLEGYEGEWEEKTLESLVFLGSGRDYKHLNAGSIPVYGTGGYMLSVDQALSEKDDAVGIGRKGTIDSPYILRAPFWTVDTLFYALPKDRSTLNYVYALFQTVDWCSLDESTGVPSLSKENIYGHTVVVPKAPKEQRAIGEFFSNFDVTINESTTKIEKLKNLRATMLVKMFPQGTSKVPEIRIDGFEGDWTFLTLGEEAEFLKGSGFAKKDLRNDGSPIVLYGRLYTQYETVIQEVDTFVDPSDQKCVTSRGGEVLVPASGETAEDIAVATVLAVPGVIIGSDLNIVRPFNKLESEFLALSISHGEVHKRLAMSAQGKTVVHLKNDDLRELSVPIPTPEEQRAIGNFFRELDDLIDAEELKLTKLTNLKNTFLSKMFV